MTSHTNDIKAGHHHFVCDATGKNIFCEYCGAIKLSYYMAPAKQRENEQPKVEAPCPGAAS